MQNVCQAGYSGVGVGKTKPTWRACGGKPEDLSHRATARGWLEPRLTGAASLGAVVTGKGKVLQGFWALAFTGNISCHRIRFLIFLRSRARENLPRAEEEEEEQLWEHLKRLDQCKCVSWWWAHECWCQSKHLWTLFGRCWQPGNAAED